MKIRATIALLLAGTCWGTISLFLKPLYGLGISPLQVPFLRMLVATLIIVPYCLLVDKKALCINPRDLWMFLGTGIVSVTLFNACYFYTIIHGQVSIAVVLLYTSPLFILVFSALLFKEKITTLKLLALGLTLVGCVFVSGLLGGSVSLSPFIFLTGIGAGLFYALYTIFSRYALKKYSSLTIITYTFLLGLLSSAFIGDVPKAFETIVQTPTILLWCVGLGIFNTVVPYFLYTWGLHHTESGKAAILVAIEPVVGSLLGILVYHESHDIGKVLGILLVILAIFLLNLPQKKSGEN
ncbi:MAG: EamA family transporter [Clostridia bacterium]|nr:EamA family transporter [Clostridia bacterium]